MIAIKVKIMPSSPKSDLLKIKNEAEKKIKKLGASLHSSSQEDIAFGLKALILLIAWPEDKSPEELETQLSSLNDIKSAQIIDVRRAVG